MRQKNNSTVTSLCEAGDLALQDLTSLVNINMTGLKVEESAECDITAFLGDCLHTHPARTPISQPAAQLSCDQLINNHSSTPVALPYHFPDLNTCSMTSLVRSLELAYAGLNKTSAVFVVDWLFFMTLKISKALHTNRVLWMYECVMKQILGWLFPLMYVCIT